MPAGANREPESENTSLEDKLHFKNLTMEESIFWCTQMAIKTYLSKFHHVTYNLENIYLKRLLLIYPCLVIKVAAIK